MKISWGFKKLQFTTSIWVNKWGMRKIQIAVSTHYLFEREYLLTNNLKTWLIDRVIQYFIKILPFLFDISKHCWTTLCIVDFKLLVLCVIRCVVKIVVVLKTTFIFCTNVLPDALLCRLHQIYIIVAELNPCPYDL